MLEWYFGLPILARVVLPVIVLGIAAVRYFVEGVVWPWGWAIGAILLITCIPTHKSSKGYREY